MKNVLYIGFEGSFLPPRQDARPVRVFRSRRDAVVWTRSKDQRYHFRHYEKIELGKMHDECERCPEMAKCCDLCRPLAEKIAPYAHLLNPTNKVLP